MWRCPKLGVSVSCSLNGNTGGARDSFLYCSSWGNSRYVSQLIQGITNSQLNARGRKQALALGRGLRANGLMIDRVVASDLLRAQETAQQILLGMQVKLAIETDKGLREENDGVLKDDR